MPNLFCRNIVFMTNLPGKMRKIFPSTQQLGHECCSVFFLLLAVLEVVGTNVSSDTSR